MQSPSIASVKEQLESYRKHRPNRRHPIPDEIIASLKVLSKSLPLSKIQRELKISESVIKRVREPKSQDVIRLAPINIAGPTSPLVLEISSARGETISVRGLSGASELAQLIRILREA